MNPHHVLFEMVHVTLTNGSREQEKQRFFYKWGNSRSKELVKR